MTREEIIKSLQHAIDYMNEHEGNRITETAFRGEIIDTVIHKNTLIEAIKLLEKQKTSKWVGIEYDGYADGNPVYDVWECSCCHEEYEGDFDSLPNYCPECGAKMEVEDGKEK